MKLLIGPTTVLDSVPLLPSEIENDKALTGVRPVQYSKKQQQLKALTFKVVSEKGVTLDNGILLVNTRTGHLSMERYGEVLQCAADLMDAPAPKRTFKRVRKAKDTLK